ncbi:monocarboxylate transporter 12-like [Diadema setosum]|uniref:monocarboxylate transporter 12-like n=1 Tax=Diadema setosum TaxID=31175 RepID=UPI003B3A20A2
MPNSTKDGLGCMSRLRRHWGWVVTFASYLIYFITIGVIYCFGIITVAVQNDLNSSVAATGWIPSIASGLSLISVAIVDSLVRRFSHRLVSIIGVVLCFIACLVTSFMPSVFPMYFTFGLAYGTGAGICTFSGMLLVVEHFPSEHRSRATSLAVAGTTTGMLVLNPVVYGLLSALGWRSTLRILGAVVLGLGITMSAFLTPVSKMQKKGHVSDDAIHENSISPLKKTENEGKITAPNTLRPSRQTGRYEVYKFPEWWILLLATISSQMSISIFFFYWAKLVLSLGFKESTAAVAMTIMAASELAGKLTIAVIADHLPFPKLYLHYVPIVVGVCIMLSIKHITTLPLIFVISSITGFFVASPLNTLPYVITSEVFPNRGSVPMTSMVVAVGLGLTLGAVYGYSLDFTGSFSGALNGCIAAYAFSAVLLLSVVLYQKYLAEERYVMWNTVRHRHGVKQACKDNDLAEL